MQKRGVIFVLSILFFILFLSSFSSEQVFGAVGDYICLDAGDTGCADSGSAILTGVSCATSVGCCIREQAGGYCIPDSSLAECPFSQLDRSSTTCDGNRVSECREGCCQE